MFSIKTIVFQKNHWLNFVLKYYIQKIIFFGLFLNFISWDLVGLYYNEGV
jgi:hypothetical protein